MDRAKDKIKKYSQPMKTVGIVSSAILVFIAGWLIGSDRINFARNTPSNLASQVVTDLPADIPTGEVQEIYDELRKNFDGKLEEPKLEDGLKKGMVAAAGDPHTEYLSSSELEQFNSQLEGSFEGIGAELGNKNGEIIVISPIKGFPAEKAGLKAGDVLIGIDDTDASGLTVSEAVSKIRGKAGTEVRLTVVRDGKKEVIPIVRSKIDVPSVESNTTDGICYIQIRIFGEDTTPLVEQAARKCSDAGLNKAILDVRGNPGGLLDHAVGVSSVWLQNGKTVLEEKRDGKTIQSYQAEGFPLLNDFKTAVLIDGGSASASEIVAGALRDNGAATLIGVKSYGKGSVQNLIKLKDGGALKVTIARWYTPNGKNIDKEGIQPDREVKLSDDDIKNGNDAQLQAAKNFLQTQ